MKKMYLPLLLITAAALITAGCSGALNNGEADKPDKLSYSIAEVPESILPPSGDTGRRSVDEGDIADIYSLIPEYVNMAADIRDHVVGIMESVLRNFNWLDSLERDTLAAVEDGELTHIKISDLSGEYERKLYLYFDGGTDPRYIISYSVSDNGYGKGVILYRVSGTFEGTADIASVTTAEIIFDSTSAPQALDIRYHRDLTGLRTYAQGLTDPAETELRSLDLAQPEQISLSVRFDGTEYLVSGYSYHPGIEELQSLGLEDYFELLKESRHTYLFRTVIPVTEEGTETGAKLSLAFPVDDAADLTGVWTDDALGTLYTDYMVEFANSLISEETNPVKKFYNAMYITLNVPDPDDYTVLPESYFTEYFEPWVDEMNEGLTAAGVTDAKSMQTYFDGLTSEEKNGVRQEDFGVLYHLSNAGTVAWDTAWTQEAYNNAVSTLGNWDGLDYTAMNQLYQDAASDETKKFYLSLLMIAYISEDHGFTVTQEELETFLYDPDLDEPEVLEFRNLYESVKYIVNPAFYKPEEGFIGTLNTETDQFYLLSGGALVPSADRTVIEGLIDLDLSSVTVLIPADELGYFESFQFE
jgi:hypothetical protein